MELEPRSSRLMRLADDSRVAVTLYQVEIVWDGVVQRALVLASGSEPLLGTSLLLGHRLTVDVVDGGEVTIDRL